MDWLKITCISITLLYAVFILCNALILLFQKKENEISENYNPFTSITIIIPARNEENTLTKCLVSIALQDFPKHLLQVIIVDDHSTDQTKPIAEKFAKENYQLLSLENASGKKQAILKAIDCATGKIIITRDADTFSSTKFWLKSIVQHFETTNCDLLISPVILDGNNSFINSFQQFENIAISSLGMSMAKMKLPFVCSGANLAYKKETFQKIQPYADNLNVASGDDMFLLKHFYLNNCKIEANTSTQALIYTPAENSFKNMLSQRLRWASKASKISTRPIFLVGLLVLIMNTLYLPIGCLGFFNSSYLPVSLFTLTLKFIIDFLLLFLSARMYKQKVNWLWFFLSFLFNGLYVPTVVFASFFVKPNWKSRKI